MGGHGELLELLHARLREALLEMGGAMARPSPLVPLGTLLYGETGY